MKLHQLFEAKITAAQKKSIEAQVRAAKQSDGKVTLDQLRDAVYAADDADSDDPVPEAVYKEVQAWSEKCRAEYKRLEDEVTELEKKHKVYLFDDGVDRENVLVGGRTEYSADFWSSMLYAGGSAIGERASAAGLDINKLLGRNIY
jgi:hypothetical protein